MNRETGYYWVVPWNGRQWTVRFFQNTENVNGLNGRWIRGNEITNSDNEDRMFSEINETRIKNPDELQLDRSAEKANIQFKGIESFCCGRCDGINDFCIYDKSDEAKIYNNPNRDLDKPYTE